MGPELVIYTEREDPRLLPRSMGLAFGFTTRADLTGRFATESVVWVVCCLHAAMLAVLQSIQERH